MQLNQYGEIVKKEWLQSAVIRKEIDLEEFVQFVLIPNHFYGIVIIKPVGAIGSSPLPQSLKKPIMPLMKPKSLLSLISGFKSSVTKQINLISDTPRMKVWQRNYYEHIIRNEKLLNTIRQYIVNNPLSW